MAPVKSEELQTGMLVTRDVKNIDGMLLVPAGCGLSEQQIGILQARNVTEMEIEASDEQAKAYDPLAQLPLGVAAQLTADLRARFWKPDEFGPVPAKIFRLMRLRQARRALHPPAHPPDRDAAKPAARLCLVQKSPQRQRLLVSDR